MKEEIFKKLEIGDLVKHKLHPYIYVVMDVEEPKVIVSRIAIMTIPNEWDLVSKANYYKIEE